MMKRLPVLAALAALASAPASAGNHPHGSLAPAVSEGCPYADTASTDGCLQAPTASAYTAQHPNFFTSYALQSGQSYTGASFTGAISGGVLTVSGASRTVIAASDTIIGAGVPAGVHVASFGTGTGGNGTYNLANATGLTVGSETMNGLRRPPWNVAGVDYPVGIQTYPAGCGTSYTCLPSGLKDPSVVANLMADGVYSTTNGCQVNAYLSTPTFFCNGASAPATITLDGYDFCSLNSTGAAGLPVFVHANINTSSHVILKNSLVCSGANTWNVGALIQIFGGGSLTIEYSYIDGEGSVWKRNAKNPTLVGGGISLYAPLAQTNDDCVTGGPGVCVQYSVLTRLSRSLSVNVPTGCTVSCDGFVYQNNYSEDGNAPYTQFTAYIGNGAGSGAPGNCLSVTAYAFGSIIAGNQVRGAGFPANGVTTTPNGCDTSGNPSVISSWTLTGVPAQYVPSETMYGMDGQHGDVPIYLAFVATSGSVIPSIQYSYNAVYLSPDTFGSTGIPTFNRNRNAGAVTSSAINNNVAVANLQSATMGGGLTASSVMGSDSNTTKYGSFNVTDNFIDPAGAANCFFLGHSATGATPTLTGNVNMLGNGFGAPDRLANSNAGNCHGRYRHARRR